jgi:hypothetical protein
MKMKLGCFQLLHRPQGRHGPREYRQTLSTLLNGLIDSGFALLHMQEETGHEPADELIPGEWDHFTAVMPPWFSFLARLDRKK